MVNLMVSNRIIELRAVGYSYDNIASMTEISKPSVIKICKNRADDIEHAKVAVVEASRTSIKESLEQRRAIYGAIHKKTSIELLTRDFSEMTTKELTTVLTASEKALEAVESNGASADSFAHLTDEQLEMIASTPNLY